MASFFDHDDTDTMSILSDCSACSYAADLLPKSRPRRARPAGQRWASAIRRILHFGKSEGGFVQVSEPKETASASTSTSTSTTSLASSAGASSAEESGEKESTKRRWSQFSISR